MYRHLETTDLVFCGIIIVLTFLYFFITNTLPVQSTIFLLTVAIVTLISFANLLFLINSFTQIEDALLDIERSIENTVTILKDKK